MKNLELTQMTSIHGFGNPLTDQTDCQNLALGLGGASLIFGAAAWWTGVGGGLALAGSVAAYAYGAYCNSL